MIQIIYKINKCGLDKSSPYIRDSKPFITESSPYKILINPIYKSTKSLTRRNKKEQDQTRLLD
jgi:hypothetical protein